MLLLAIDTSGKFGSIALAQCGPEDECRILEVLPLIGGTFSAQLVPQIAALLKKHRVTKRDIGGFAAASGPGSFTGLRVGLAAIKALAEVLNKPIAAASLLEAVAESANSSGRGLAVLDAGRKEVYVAEFAMQGGRSHLGMEKLMTQEECINSGNDALIVTPDAQIAEAARHRGLKAKQIERPCSDAIARIGWRKIRAGQTISPEELEANYIRRSDAEIFSKSRQ
ncbi:MAG TPA: tRNA (adenosine(37)-N6)-threonylcarbamoyltransferase complex dimerization subunit type 1 TsaB [Terriglobales bacterium]|nr:tRNA (adenosine(37)-N6)-threonylcarbamoyltransferase complex dimerization subunit type 1 TsaB [Terriglobales bacterium]